MIGVPDYIEPYEYTVEGTWEPGDRNKYSIHQSITVRMDGTKDRPQIVVNRDDDVTDRQTLWTVVHWAREYGVPGVWKEGILLNEHEYRLGGLYCIAGMDLTERETNYTKYGENPYAKR